MVTGQQMMALNTLMKYNTHCQHETYNTKGSHSWYHGWQEPKIDPHGFWGH